LWYAIRIGSIANVNGLIDAIHPSHSGIKDMGANAVLEKRTGRLNMKIIAISSMCPGKTNANPRLRPVIANTNNNNVIAIRKKPPKLGQPYPNRAEVAIIAKLCKRLMLVM